MILFLCLSVTTVLSLWLVEQRIQRWHREEHDRREAFEAQWRKVMEEQQRDHEGKR